MINESGVEKPKMSISLLVLQVRFSETTISGDFKKRSVIR